MAQLNITLNQDEILQLLSDNRDDAFKCLLQESLNSILKVESSAQLGAEKYERSSERTDSRNGTRERNLNTRIGTVTLNVPRHRNVPFKTLVFDNYSRSEAALVASMAEMVVNGVSTRKVSTVIETLCGTSYSKSTVSEVCKELDESVNSFKTRPLDGEYPFLFVDATYLKVRGAKRIEARALMVAVAIKEDLQREIVGFEVYDKESNETWKSFFETLKQRGLRGLKMVTSDCHQGIVYALSRTFPDVPWQRCQTHFSRNILEHTPKKYQKAIGAALLDMYHATSIKEAKKKRDEIIDEYQAVAEKAMECLENGFEDVMTIMSIPEGYRRYLRTSNHLERLNREIKRRTKVIGIFPNEASINRLVGSLLSEVNDVYTLQNKIHISKKDQQVLSSCATELMLIAKKQQQMMLAA